MALREDDEADENGWVNKTFERGGHSATVYCCGVYRGVPLASPREAFFIIICLVDHEGGVDFTGLLVWQASTVLAHFIGARSDVFADKSCIELGSGAGLTGLFCAQFARKVIMTDRNDEVLTLLRDNIVRNKLTPERCSVAELSWGEPLPAEVAQAVPFEVVLASDVVYPGHTPEVVHALFQSTLALLAPTGVFVISYVPRAVNVWDMIQASVAQATLVCTEVPWQEFMPTPPPLGAKLLLIRRKAT